MTSTLIGNFLVYHKSSNHISEPHHCHNYLFLIEFRRYCVLIRHIEIKRIVI